MWLDSDKVLYTLFNYLQHSDYTIVTTFRYIIWECVVIKSV
jgi:hypothetical protein